MFKLFKSKFYKCGQPDCTFETWFKSRAIKHAEEHDEQAAIYKLPGVFPMHTALDPEECQCKNYTDPLFYERHKREAELAAQEASKRTPLRHSPDYSGTATYVHTDAEHEEMLRRKRLQDEEEEARRKRQREDESSPLTDMVVGYAAGKIIESILDNNSPSTDTETYTPGGGRFGGGGASGSWDEPDRNETATDDSSSTSDDSSSASDDSSSCCDSSDSSSGGD